MPELHLSVTFHVLLIIFAALLAVLISLASYHVTVPPISRRLAVTLTILRSTGLFLLFLLIGEPLLSFIDRTQERPGIAVLLDNSKSMTINDNAGDRKATLLQALRSDGIQALASIGSPSYILFDSHSRVLQSFAEDSLNFSGDATDLAAAFRTVQTLAATRNIRSIVLLSDGNSNLGSSPLFESEELDIPLFTIGIGDSTEQRDMLIRKVVTNSVSYIGNRVPVHVTFKSSGYGARRVEVTVRDAERIHDRRFLELQEGTREYPLTLFVTPSQEGVQKFTVQVSKLPEELTDRNNSSGFFMKVLKSKMKVLLIAGAPNPDVSFVRNAFESDKNVELTTRVERFGGQFYEGPLTPALLQGTDCIVLIGYPGSASPPDVVHQVENAANLGKGVFFIPSRTIDGSKLLTFQSVLPFTLLSFSRGEEQVFFHVPEAQRNNTIVKQVGAAGTAARWEKLPPLFKLQAAIRSKPESEIIAFTRIQNTVTSEPLLLSRSVNRRKSLALLGYGLWRWKISAESDERFFEEFLGNAVRWLTTREDDRRVRVAPTKEVFSAQDPLEFTSQVYDDSFRGIDNAQVSVSVSRGSERYDYILSPLGSGQYEGSFETLPEGDYTFQATVTAGGEKVGEDRGSFSVGGLNIEFQDTRLNKSLLEQLAARSGGVYYDPDDLKDLPHAIQSIPSFQPREVVRSSEVELWNAQWSLAVLIAFFASEWYLRKRNGML